MTVQLYQGDCMDILKTLPDGAVDAVVTDPPWAVGFKYATYTDTPVGYGEFIRSVAIETQRVARDGAPIMIWQAAKHVHKLAEWFPWEWRLLIAAKNFAQILPGPTWASYDPIVTWWKGGRGEAFGKVRRDYHLADTTPSGRKRRGEVVDGHPCPRPIEHLLWVVDTWVRPGGTVLDPFMGSGTTGVACVQTGRNFIGIEIDPHYFEIGKKRIAEAQAQPPLLEVNR